MPEFRGLQIRYFYISAARAAGVGSEIELDGMKWRVIETCWGDNGEFYNANRSMVRLTLTPMVDYTAPECPFDFAAGIRDRIVEDVTLHGLTYRCLADTANAFHDWSDAQIDEWLHRNSILMRRHHDGGWMFRSRHTHDLSEFESAVRERAPEMVENYHRMVNESIRAEVEAMDWPEVIDG